MAQHSAVGVYGNLGDATAAVASLEGGGFPIALLGGVDEGPGGALTGVVGWLFYLGLNREKVFKYEEAIKAGVLLATGGLADPKEAIKVTYHNGEFTVLDGPFTEAKELIGGWALMEVRDSGEAIEWTKRFLTVVGEGESTIRQVFGP